jgi:hypothetical protein
VSSVVLPNVRAPELARGTADFRRLGRFLDREVDLDVDAALD